MRVLKNARLGVVLCCLLAAGCAGTNEAARSNDSPSQSTRPAASPTAQAATPQTEGATPTPADTPASAEAGDTSPQAFEGTAAAVEKKKGDIAPVVLRAVRTAEQATFDRVVFEFEGDSLPGYRVEYVNESVQCGSGEAVRVEGQGRLRVQLRPAQAHTEKGEATVKERERRPRLKVLRELKATCDFEAEVEWVLGVASKNRYRVLELSKPTRLVVDVKH